jgi:hypothetical protein
MPDLFGIDIAGIINDSITEAGGLVDAVLVVVEAGQRIPSDLTSGTNPIETSKDCQGFKDTLDRLRPDTVVAEATDLILLLGASIQDEAIPKTGDKIIIENETKSILKVKRDPAAATYECQVN